MPENTIAGVAVIFLAAILTNNILLAKFLGMCSFIAISRNMRTAFGMGVAVTFVTFCTALLNHMIYHDLLVAGGPFWAYVIPRLQAWGLAAGTVQVPDLTFLHFIVFIMVIAGFVQLVEMIIERFVPVLYYNLGIFLPLITVNCAILGVNILMIDPDKKFTLWKTGAYGLGSGLGWLLAICLMAGIRQKLDYADVPKPLRGLGITMIVTGLMAMAFMGFSGVVDL
jgi:Na+-transporting NADH:ubiquinone oxidoreductase subunit E